MDSRSMLKVLRSISGLAGGGRLEPYSSILNTPDYISAETFIISLVKIVFKNDHYKRARDKYKE